jgi:hypothetical protein
MEIQYDSSSEMGRVGGGGNFGSIGCLCHLES